MLSVEFLVVDRPEVEISQRLMNVGELGRSHDLVPLLVYPLGRAVNTVCPWVHVFAVNSTHDVDELVALFWRVLVFVCPLTVFVVVFRELNFADFAVVKRLVGLVVLKAEPSFVELVGRDVSLTAQIIRAHEK